MTRGKPKNPEELEHVWDEEVSEAWKKLKPKHQLFFLEWLNNGYNASQAYRDTYNELANDKTASAAGARLLATVSIQQLCAKLNNDKETDLRLIKKAYIDGLGAFKPIFSKSDELIEIDDHPTRIKAADSLAKLNGQLVEREIVREIPDDQLNTRIEELEKRINKAEGKKT